MSDRWWESISLVLLSEDGPSNAPRDRRKRCHRDRNTQLLTAITVWWTASVRATQPLHQSSYCSTQTSLLWSRTITRISCVLRIILLFLHSAERARDKTQGEIICLNPCRIIPSALVFSSRWTFILQSRNISQYEFYFTVTECKPNLILLNIIIHLTKFRCFI